MSSTDKLTLLAADFCTITGQLLDENAEIIKRLREAKDIDLDEAVLNNAAAIIKTMDADELLDAFIDCHDDWVQMRPTGSTETVTETRDRIIKFILETVPRTYVNVPFDVELLTVSVERYMFHKNKGQFNGVVDELDWPVNNLDVDNMREYFVTMITIACEYIFAGRLGRLGSDGKIMGYANPSFKESTPLEKYVEMFGIKLA